MADSEKERYFEDIFDRYSKDIFRYIYFRVSSYEAAEDLTSEVFIKFWKKFLVAADIQNARALLYTIAHGVVVDEYRKKAHMATVSVEAVDPAFFAREDGTEESIDAKAEIDRLYTTIVTLKTEYKDILLLYYIEEVEVPDIARILNKKEGTIRVLIHRALEALKKAYE